jgi:NADP-dependent 3-hydroxy acid dehydrogenase YdfG
MAPTQQVWLVTGCSSGFGEAFIKSIIQRGDKAIATARRLDSIEHLAELGAATMQLDVTDSQLELNEKIKEAWAIYDRIDVLVQNAGYGLYGAAEDVTYTKDTQYWKAR